MTDEKQTTGETISELARRHLKDQNHTTSDEELRNARVVLDEAASDMEESSSNSDTRTKELQVEGDNSESKKEPKGFEQQGHPPNPYDVLG